jgi:hypothetical protein
MALALNGDAMDASPHRIVAFAAALLSTAVLAGEPDTRAEPIKLRLDPLFILEAVARRLNVPLQPEIVLPKILVSSRTPLTQFQDALEEQWGIRPDAFVNAYAVVKNEIYLFDGASFYSGGSRTIEDSLAHEFVHYIQARYWGEDLRSDDCELQAVTVQRWFRELYLPAFRPIVASLEP